MEENIPKIRQKKKKPYINMLKEKWRINITLGKDLKKGRNHDEYKKEKNSLHDLTRKLQKEFEKDFINKLKKVPKAFWQYGNSKLKTRSKISQLFKLIGTLTQIEEQHTQVLNEFFSNVFTEEDLNQIPTLETWYQNDPMEYIHIIADMVLKTYKKKKIVLVNQQVQMESILLS